MLTTNMIIIGGAWLVAAAGVFSKSVSSLGMYLTLTIAIAASILLH